MSANVTLEPAAPGMSAGAASLGDTGLATIAPDLTSGRPAAHGRSPSAASGGRSWPWSGSS